jgi:hypothetical protein
MILASHWTSIYCRECPILPMRHADVDEVERMQVDLFRECHEGLMIISVLSTRVKMYIYIADETLDKKKQTETQE